MDFYTTHNHRAYQLYQQQERAMGREHQGLPMPAFYYSLKLLFGSQIERFQQARQTQGADHLTTSLQATQGF